MEKFVAFKFVARRHFGFYDVLWLPLSFGSRGSFCERIGQPLHVLKSKMSARGKFKSY